MWRFFPCFEFHLQIVAMKLSCPTLLLYDDIVHTFRVLTICVTHDDLQRDVAGDVPCDYNYSEHVVVYRERSALILKISSICLIEFIRAAHRGLNMLPIIIEWNQKLGASRKPEYDSVAQIKL